MQYWGAFATHCCRGKAGSITYSECLSVAFVIPQAKRMRRIILYLWPVWPYHIFPLYLVGDTVFGINIKCVLWFSLQLLSETFLILRRIERVMITNVHTSLDEKLPLFLSYFNKTFCFLDRFSKNANTSNLMKVQPVEAEMFHAGRQSDRQTRRS
jgi:hypothetical protein